MPFRSAFSALLVLLLLAPAAHAQSDGAAGRWLGEITIPATALRVDVTLTRGTDGTWTGTIDIPQQNAKGMELENVRAPGDSAIFTIAGVPGAPTFRGVVDSAATTMTGMFLQGLQQFPFKLERAAAAPSDSTLLEGFDTLVAKALADFDVPGVAIGIVHNGKVVHARGYGLRDVERKLPVTAQTIFAIGSSTKAFTTLGLGIMADSGRFSWDEPVREYLPTLRLHDEFAGARVTARDMVTHRTGLPRHDLAWYANRTLTPDSMLALMRWFEPNREFREAWQYNNMMFVMAGHLLATLAGTTWEQAIDSLVLSPLEMARTNFSVIESRADADHALPYRENADTLVRMEFRDISHVGPAGSINSSIEDMLKWVQLHLTEGRHDGTQVVSGAMLREMHTPQMVMPGFPTDAGISPSSYALGWMVHTYRGHYRVFHGGNIDGFSALVTLFPLDKLGVVVLTNMNGTALPELLTRHAADRLLDLETRDWLGEALAARIAAQRAQAVASARLDAERRKGTKPSLPLEQFAGEYEHPGYGLLQVTTDSDRLVVRYNDITTPFEHWHFDVFNGLENVREPVFHNMKLQFNLDLHGRVGEALMAMEPMMPPIRFERRADAQLRDPDHLARFVGRYAMDGGGAPARISLSNATLTLTVAGQPPYVLAAERDNEFRFADIDGFRVRFVLDDAGSVTEMQVIQPNGVFVARPVR